MHKSKKIGTMSTENQSLNENKYLKSLHVILNLPITITQLELALLNISYEHKIKEHLYNFVGKENLDLSILALNKILKNHKIQNKEFENEFQNFDFKQKELNLDLVFLSSTSTIIDTDLIHVKGPFKSTNGTNPSTNREYKKNTGFKELNCKTTEDKIPHTQKYEGPLKNQHYGFVSETYINNITETKDPLKKTDILKIVFGFEYFNYIQSDLLPICLNQTNNFILSAPTGMGKSEVALLCVIKSLLPKINYTTEIDISKIQKIERNIHRIIYLVPMKALASQTVNFLNDKLKSLNLLFTNIKEKITIEEYTGDTDYLPKSHILVCTPEKFEFFLIKNPKNTKYINLIVFDEIHILGTSRGVCIERMIYNLLKENMRIIGLSATISNLNDLSKFVKGNEYKFTKKDIPVDISYLNIETNFNRELTLCNLLYNYLKQGISIILFVNRRKECERLASLFLNFIEKNELPLKLPSPMCDLERTFKNYSNLYSKGIGIHNSKLSKEHRFQTENMFRTNQLNLLISTSTLAWGINLPAQIVILYGLTYYNNMGKYVDYDIKDILQCIGRAGRKGIASSKSFKNTFLEIGNEYGLPKKNFNNSPFIKTKNNVKRNNETPNKNNTKNKGEINNETRNKKKLLNNVPVKNSTAHCFIFGETKQLEKYKPHFFNNILLESHLLTSLADSLLTFIEEKTTFEDLKEFFDSTYLKIRMLKKPELYGILKIGFNGYEDIYEVFKEYLIMSCKKLEKNFCILITTIYAKDDIKEFYQKTNYGRIACLYKIHHTTIGNLIKLKHRNPKTFISPLNFIMFLIQNHEFKEMEKISINQILLRKFHGDILKLPNKIFLEEDWDIDFTEDLEKYKNMDLLMNSKYHKFMNTQSVETKEHTQLFIKCIILIQLIKHKSKPKIGELTVYIDFFDKIIGRIVSGLIELEEFKTEGVLFWYDLFNTPCKSSKETYERFFS